MDGLASVELMSNDPKVEAQGPKPTPNQVEKFKLIARMTKLYNPKKSPCRKLVFKKKIYSFHAMSTCIYIHSGVWEGV